ncbi:MAG: urea ABC transporter ATP-binding protein UrtD [Anaerolineales bacterium]|nr:urea ABC transporter ATP-binding protein UrtD [Anaerolineales bacterium]
MTNILEVNKVSVSFDGFTVLNNLDFSMEQGELRFFIGPNGAGKTTMLDIITGKTKPQAGEVLFDGENISHLGEHRIVQCGIGRKFQTPSIFGSLSVFENLEAALGFRDYTPQLFGPMSAEERDLLHETLDEIGLQNRAHVRAGLLSHGEKQWLEIGMLLIQKPKLLLLDEPVAGMTRRERDRTGELLLDIIKNRSVLVVEHDMEFVRKFARTVTVLHMGNVLCEGPMDEIQNNPQVIEVYLGKAHDEVRQVSKKQVAVRRTAPQAAAVH